LTTYRAGVRPLQGTWPPIVVVQMPDLSISGLSSVSVSGKS
jgi:hypothetical protein